MGLLHFVRTKEVNEKFNETFPKPAFPLKGTIKALPLTNRYQWIGEAFDYLFRFIIERENQHVKVIKGDWVAEFGLKELPNIIEDKKVIKKAEKLIDDAKKEYYKYLEMGVLEEKLIKISLMLSQLDVVIRNAQVVRNFCTIDKIEDIDKDIKDLENLVSIIPKSRFVAKSTCILNPTFGEASELVNGADADLIIDDTLIEIKTAKELELRREYVNQLIGYYILFLIGGADRYKLECIDNLGIYFSRYGLLYKFPVKDVVIDESRLPAFIKWFKSKAKEKYSSIDFCL